MIRLLKRALVLTLLLGLFGCSTAKFCIPNHGGEIDSTTFDFMGNTTWVYGTPTQTVSIGNTNALGAAAVSILGAIAAGGKIAALTAKEPTQLQAQTGTGASAYVCP